MGEEGTEIANHRLDFFNVEREPEMERVWIMSSVLARSRFVFA